MRNLIVTAVVCAALAAGLPPARARAEASSDAGAPTTACGFSISAAAGSVWRDLGAEAGRLGCAVQPERPGPISPKGSPSSVAVFAAGEVVTHKGGAREGQSFAVVGCFYRLHVQFGGASGWLGLPIGDAQNTPDGSRQSFEGGDMRYTRAYDDCQATPNGEAPAEAAASDAIPLDIFENPTTGDRLSLSSQRSVALVQDAGYRRLRGQAAILPTNRPGATPLKLYQNEDRGLRRTIASTQSEREALADGYVFEASQGFVWVDPRPGALPLKLYLNPTTGAARLTAGPSDEADALAAGLTFRRIEGYAAAPGA